MGKKRGFTLIELLVVFAIVGGLSAIVLPNFMGARERGRDTQRKSDLRQIQKALELYQQDNSPPSYPVTLPDPGTCWSSGSNCTGNIYLNKVPGDPDGTVPPKEYYYSPNNSALTFILSTCLENQADTDLQNCPSDFTTVAGYACTSPRRCYTVKEE